MFRRLSDSLPKDPVYPANLKELGYFINDSDQIKKIDNPDEFFQFFITNNYRHNDVHREAFHTCIRAEVVKRMTSLGIAPVYLPQLSTVKPSKPHTAVLATPPEQLRQKKRVYVIVNEHYQELGIFAYRVLCKERGIEAGSANCVVRELIRRAASASEAGSPQVEKNGKPATPSTDASPAHHASMPGLVVLNPGELLYSHNRSMPLSATAWDALPRPSAVHPGTKVDPVHNLIKGNETRQAHIKFVFDNILSNPDFVDPDAEIYIIGLSDGGETVVQFLDHNWPKYETRIAAIALTQPLHSPNTLTSAPFQDFLKRSCRSYILSAAPLNTILATPTQALPYDVNENLPCKLSNLTLQPINTTPASSTKVPPTNPSSDAAAHSSTTDLTLGDQPTNTNGTLGEDDAPWGAADPPPVPDQRVTNLTLSGGETQTVECIFPTAYKVILDFFEDVARHGKGQYRNLDI